MTAYYNILETIKNQLVVDEFVNTVTQGDIFDVDLNKQTIFPLSHIMVNNVTRESNVLRFNVTVMCMDIVDKSKTETTDIFVGNDNEQDVLNTQLAVVSRMLEIFDRGGNVNTFRMDGDPNIEPFTERFENYLAGWSCTFDILVANDMTICGPLITPDGCAPATITLDNTLGTELSVTSVASGASETIVAPDANIFINSVLYANVASGRNRLINVYNSIFEQVGDVVGNDVIIPNSAISINFTLLNSLPSTKSLGINVLNTNFSLVGDIVGNDFIIQTSAITANGDAFGTVVAEGSINVEVVDPNGDVVDTSIVSGKVQVDSYPDWLPNPLWPAIPADDNTGTKAYGIFAVFENQQNLARIAVSTGATVNWGDGASDIMAGSEITHTYNYATISAPIIVHPIDGNYKAVLVEIIATSQSGVIHGFDFTRLTNQSNNFLDIVIYAGDGTTAIANGSCFYRISYSHYLERFKCRYPQNGNSFQNNAAYCSSLQVFDVPTDFLNYTASLNSAFFRSGNNCVIPCDIVNNTTLISQFAGQCHGLKFGNITLNGAGISLQNFMPFCSNAEIGNITSLTVTNCIQSLGGSGLMSTLKKIGTINMPLLENMRDMFRNGSLGKIVFTDCSNVNDTVNSFSNCFNLYELILPDITIGFNIKDSRITGDYLQDLFTSLGTASGAQTITLPSFTSSEPTAIATGKGYTIAYA